MKNQDKSVDALERMKQALELRKAGVGYAIIAERLGYKSPSGAHYAVSKALKACLQEPAEEIRNLEIERLDTAQLALWPMVRQGHLGAIDRYLRLAERRAKLLGLDAPAKVAPVTPDGLDPWTIEVRHVSYREGLASSESTDFTT